MQSAKDATDTNFDLDNKGCVKAASIQRRSDNKAYDNLAKIFSGLASAEEEHDVLTAPAGRGSSTAGKSASYLDWGENLMKYHVCGDPPGMYRGPTTPGKTFAHEVLGHQTDSFFRVVIGGITGLFAEGHAIDVENLYNRANGRGNRCGHGGSR